MAISEHHKAMTMLMTERYSTHYEEASSMKHPHIVLQHKFPQNRCRLYLFFLRLFWAFPPLMDRKDMKVGERGGRHRRGLNL